MTEKVSKIAKQEVHIDILKEKQVETERDLKEIRDSINNLDKGLTLFQRTVENMIEDSRLQNEKMEEKYSKYSEEEKTKSDLITEIYAELQEIRATQEVMCSDMNTKDTEHDEGLKKIRADMEDCKKKVEIEIKRQQDALTEYTDRTKFDWFEVFNSGVKKLLGKAVELTLLGIVAYIIMQTREGKSN